MSRPPASFFSEDDAWLVHRYRREALLHFPFPWSAHRIGYADIPELAAVDFALVRVRRTEGSWRLPDAIEQHTERAFAAWISSRNSARLHDGNAARIASVTGGASPEICLQHARYGDYARTNLILDRRPGLFQKTLRERVQPRGRLEALSNSPLANLLGVSILAVNRDGDVPLQVRSSEVLVRPGQVCATASGTVEMSDIPEPLCALGACHLLRELHEELGQAGPARDEAPHIVGLARELARGGQPELFVVVEGDFSRETAIASNAAARDGLGVETQSLTFLALKRRARVYDASSIEGALSDLEARFPRRVAAPLRAHIALWLRALDKRGLLRR